MDIYYLHKMQPVLVLGWVWMLYNSFKKYNFLCMQKYHLSRQQPTVLHISVYVQLNNTLLQHDFQYLL